ncbi:MAG TPA: IMP dehydrogenase, partial [Actinomycetota bacterium]|nr:IMP dehydrogenase [Actinomycetota bacterium]
MRAAVLAEPGRVEVTDVPDPELRHPTDAIVRVTRTAICGSDL